MEMNREVQGGHGRSLSQQISQVRAFQRQRELRLNATYKNFHQRSFDQGHSRQCSDILPHKADIFTKAGRLAAEYLVSRGLLSPSLLPGNQTNADQEKFKGKDGDFLEPRNSTTAQTVKAAPEVDQTDENDTDPLWNWHLTYRKRREPDSRGSGLDQRRDAGRRCHSVKRTPRKPDTQDADEDFPPGFGGSWRRELAEAGEKVSRIFEDDRFTRGNGKGEHTSETGNCRTKDDAILKAGSGRTRKDHPQEANLNMNKARDNGRSVVVDTVKDNTSGASEKKHVQMDDHRERKHEHDLLKLISFAEVPKKPCLPLARRIQKFAQADQGPIAEAKTTSKAALKGVSMFAHHDRKTDERCSRRDHISRPGPEKSNCGTTDDTKTKASYSRTRKTHQSEPNLNVGKLDDVGEVLHLLKTDSSGHSKKQDVLLEDKTLMQLDNDLLKIISFPQVQKKPRSLLAKRNRQIDLVGQGHTEAKRTLKVDSKETHKVAMDKGSNLGDIKSLVCMIDNASLPIKKRGKASLIQPNNKIDDQHPGREYVTADDNKLKVNSFRNRKDHPWKATMEFNDVVDDIRVTSSLKIYPSGDLEIMKDADQLIRKGDIDLLKLISMKVSRKPRTISRKKPKF